MRLLVLIAALVVPAGSAALQPHSGQLPNAKDRSAPPLAVAPGFGSNRDCPSDPRLHPVDSSGKAEFSPLGELPPGALSLAVMREVDGCHEPVVVRYGYGGVPSKADEAVPPRRPRPLLRR